MRNVLIVALMLASGWMWGCERAPEELEPTNTQRPTRTADQLSWTAPPTWNVEKTAKSGQYRAKYTIPQTGDAKHPAEMLVQRLGTGSNAGIDPKLKEFLSSWEGKGAKSPKRETFKVGELEVTLVDVSATYQFPLGAPVGPKKKAAATMLKENWRGLAAGVKTPKRGNWFFRMVGPEDTVAGARSAFVSMLQSVK